MQKNPRRVVQPEEKEGEDIMQLLKANVLSKLHKALYIIWTINYYSCIGLSNNPTHICLYMVTQSFKYLAQLSTGFQTPSKHFLNGGSTAYLDLSCFRMGPHGKLM